MERKVLGSIMSVWRQVNPVMASAAEYEQASGRPGMSGIVALAYSGNGHAEGLLQPHEMQHPMALIGETCCVTRMHNEL